MSEREREREGEREKDPLKKTRHEVEVEAETELKIEGLTGLRQSQGKAKRCSDHAMHVKHRHGEHFDTNHDEGVAVRLPNCES